MKKHIANILTLSRIIAAPALLWLEPFTAAFYTVYIFCGLTDMIDGTVARKTGSASKTGERLDSIADLLLAAVCLYKLLPELALPSWVWIWVAGIVLVKGINLVSGYVYHGGTVFLHTAANRATGLLLFLAPLSFELVKIEYTAAVLCAAASFAAVQEGYLIGKKV